MCESAAYHVITAHDCSAPSSPSMDAHQVVAMLSSRHVERCSTRSNSSPPHHARTILRPITHERFSRPITHERFSRHSTPHRVDRVSATSRHAAARGAPRHVALHGFSPPRRVARALRAASRCTGSPRHVASDGLSARPGPSYLIEVDRAVRVRVGDAHHARELRLRRRDAEHRLDTRVERRAERERERERRATEMSSTLQEIGSEKAAYGASS